MNNVTLIGNISTDLELKQTTGGKAVCQFNLAVNGYGDKTDFIPVQVWNKQAETKLALSGASRLKITKLMGKKELSLRL